MKPNQDGSQRAPVESQVNHEEHEEHEAPAFWLLTSDF
jgi:hypothetical protein